MKKLMLLCLLMFSSQVFAAAHTQDTGTIGNLYVNTFGDVAITISGGFPNANQKFACETGASGYAGAVNLDPFVKAALLTAKNESKTVRVTVDGCVKGWFKIMDIYIQ